MSLIGRLNNDMKQSMKNRDKDTLSVIRMLKASLQNEGIRLRRELSEDEEITILSRELKQRKDSLHDFNDSGREDLVDKLRYEITVVEAYLPKPLSEEELKEIVLSTISQVQATNKADMGKVMAAIMPKVKGRADGAFVNKLVLQHLS